MKHIYGEGVETPRAAILNFPRKRGRPKTSRPNFDTGTPELVMKRALGTTAEALDLCVEREIITSAQHWCGIHLRWLHTLRYGVPGIRAVDPTHIKGFDNKIIDAEWRSAREREYHEAMNILHKQGYAALVTRICIYNERPLFLNIKLPVTEKRAREIETTINDLKKGLDVLDIHWHGAS